jgi:putative aldouronate transport system substrate-binding protein
LSKEVVLTGYFIGSQEEELPLVLAEFNKMLKADINAEFRVQTVGWGDRTSKFPLLFASGEPFDIVYVSAWHFFQDEAPKGTFLPLDDLLAKYAPNILKDTPKEYWDSVTYNGKIYAIPQITSALDAKGIFYREDLRKKYGAAPIKTIEDWVAFMKVIAANDPTVAPFYDLPTGNVLDLYHAPNDIIYYGKLRSTVYRIADGKQFHNLTELPEYEKYVNFARQMYTQGLFPRNALANKTAARDFFKAGGAASVVLNFPNVITDQGQLLDSQPSWEVGFLPLDYDSRMNPESPINNAIAIYRGSKNPERAMMMMELIRSKRPYFQLLANGIEGRHYINIGDNRWDFPAGKNANNVGYTGAFSWWGFLKGDFVLNGAKDWKFAVDLQKEYMESPRFLPYRVMDSFILDTASIQAELAALANVEAQYKVPLDWGVVDPADPVNGLPMLRRKLKEAGIDRVLAEYNKQLATHLAAKK